MAAKKNKTLNKGRERVKDLREFLRGFMLTPVPQKVPVVNGDPDFRGGRRPRP